MGSGVALFDPYTESVLTNIGINIVVTLSMYFPLAVGQLSIAQVGFMAIGAHLATCLRCICIPPLLSLYWPQLYSPGSLVWSWAICSGAYRG